MFPPFVHPLCAVDERSRVMSDKSRISQLKYDGVHHIPHHRLSPPIFTLLFALSTRTTMTCAPPTISDQTFHGRAENLVLQLATASQDLHHEVEDIVTTRCDPDH
jgi:hypothetical protein